MPQSPASRRVGRLGASIALALVALGASPRAGSAQLAVVVNPGNTLAGLSLDQLRRLFLGQAKTFPTGQHARLARHTPSAATFDREALGLQPEIVRSRWMALIFRGEVTVVPADFSSADEVKQFVRSHPDAIAFMPAGQVDPSVKVLEIDGKRPTDAGYVLR